MWPDRVSNPGRLTYESGGLPTALRGPALSLLIHLSSLSIFAHRNSLGRLAHPMMMMIMMEGKKKGNDQELIQSNPTTHQQSCQRELSTYTN